MDNKNMQHFEIKLTNTTFEHKKLIIGTINYHDEKIDLIESDSGYVQFLKNMIKSVNHKEDLLKDNDNFLNNINNFLEKYYGVILIFKN